MNSARTVVLAIGADLEEGYRRLRAIGTASVSLHSDSANVKTTGAVYPALRLGGEHMLVAVVEQAKVSQVVNTLKRSSQAPIFTIAAGLRSAAAQHEAIGLRQRLRNAERRILEVHRSLQDAAELGHLVSPAAQWLFENAHSLRSHLAGVRDALTRSLLLHVPQDAQGVPRVHELVEATLRESDWVVNEQSVIAALESHQQQKAVLQISEIWLVPALIRLALVEFLARHGEAVAFSQQLREAAYFWGNRLAAASQSGAAEFDRALQMLAAEPFATQPYFLMSVAEQLQEAGRALGCLREWIEAERKLSLTALVTEEHQAEAAESVAIANAFTSLRTLADVDFLNVFETVSRVEQRLKLDPGGVYPASDLETKNQGRRAIQELARHSGATEVEAADAAVAIASANPLGAEGQSHVLFYLLDAGRPLLEQKLNARAPFKRRMERAIRSRATGFYLGSIAVLTLLFSLLTLGLALELHADRGVLLALLWVLTLFPLSELAIQIVNVLVISFFPATSLARMDFRRGIPAEHATLIVVPMMLANREVADQEVEKLEVRYLANPRENLAFSLFSDFVDAPQQTMPEDSELLAHLRAGIESLNARYPAARFLLFHRQREWSESEQRWIGRERKRGKVEDLNSFLLHGVNPGILITGRIEQRVKYVITLDADTQLPPESARRMIEVLAHPLNRPVLDPVTKVRRRGYTIVQPRVTISLPGATATRFTRIMSDPNGTDPYSRIVSDAQQDLFGHAIFHGKAIYDLEAFATSLHDRFPPEAILSHDLIEGSHCGVGLASDVELFENMPVDYASYSRRQHRWIRGDWQIAPWIGPRVPSAQGKVANPLGAIHRWRVFDNLRRSLVPAVSVALLLFGWFLSGTPYIWSLAVALAIVIPALANLLDRVALRISGSVSRVRGAADELVRAAVFLFFLPHQAWLSLDAIARACYRVIISRRNLLEWQTAESAGLAAATHMSAAMRQLALISAVSAVLAFWQAWLGRSSAFPFLALWIVSPFFMEWLASMGELPFHARLGSREKDELRRLGRLSWRFFDDLVNESTNWLPPDNTQLAIRIEVAHRTSPTNIGLWLDSALAAHDFGYLTSDELRERCGHTLDTLGRMERYRGHLFNWYDPHNLQPLEPRYVSTVDSGNLIACLWVLEQGCVDVLAAPAVGDQLWQGLVDTLENLQRVSTRDVVQSAEFRALRKMLRRSQPREAMPNRARAAAALIERVQERCSNSGDEAQYWALRLARHAESLVAAAAKYYSWLDTLARLPAPADRLDDRLVALRRKALVWNPSLESLASDASSPVDELVDHGNRLEINGGIVQWLDEIRADHERARHAAAESVMAWSQLARQTRDLADSVDMAFLYDRRRKLFGVGVAPGDSQEFTSYYDLLASECRIASLIAIAKSDVPLEHWFSLGRPHVPSPSGQTLLSWSGTMFEYLMPLLFMRSYPNSLLEHASKDAVERQMDFGEQHGQPWGVSESAYSAVDANGTYQYHAFGIPDLSLRGIREDECVVAPYATALALQVDPLAALANLRRLRELGLQGPMGFYEAIDFSRSAKPEGERGVIIYTYMAHHQGMTMLALDNVVLGDPMRRRFHSNLRIRAMESLLFERIPDSPLTRTEKPPPEPEPQAATAESSADRVWAANTAVPRVHLLGNGRYSVMVSNAGVGYSRWKEFDISRWRADRLHPTPGFCLYLRDTTNAEPWPATENATAVFALSHATLERRWNDIESSVLTAVAPDQDVELRKVTIRNHASQVREIEVTSYLELALAPHSADRAHPAFSKLFIQTECTEPGVLIAGRRRRSPDDDGVWAAHVLEGAQEFETSREAFLGRGRTLATAAAFDGPLTQASGTVVDPCFSFRTRLTLQPSETREVVFYTVVAAEREELLRFVSQIRGRPNTGKLIETAWNRAQLELRFLRIGSDEAHLFQQIASALLFPLREWNQTKQSDLWPPGISGDLPLVTVVIAEASGLLLVRELLLAHSYLRSRGLIFDLVIVNEEPVSYDAPLRQQIQYLVQGHAAGSGVFVVTLAEHIVEASHWVFRGSRGLLRQQLPVETERNDRALTAAPAAHKIPTSLLPFLELAYFNGWGGFSADGREYAIYLAPGSQTPAPWANVIARDGFGTVVTDSGLGWTWFGNSQSNRITPWHNDPVADPQSETIVIRDEESGAIWSPTPQPLRAAEPYRIRHGQGYTVFEHNSHALRQELTVFVSESVKVCRLRLQNESGGSRRLSVTCAVEFVLGADGEQSRVAMEFDTNAGAIFATQWWRGAQAGQPAFLAVCAEAVFTGHGLRTHITIEGNDAAELVFLIGQARTKEECLRLIERFRSPEAIGTALAKATAEWDDLLGALTVRTPLHSVDLLLNRWLIYQTLGCRLRARSGFYQSGGAIGFRDQLQDSLALLYTKPDLVREHILKAATRQFPQGDVQHWWHEDSGLGVRTRCSDDKLWLPYAVCRYVEVTGDATILAEQAPYLEGPELAPGENERMFLASPGRERGSLREHCLRAIKHAAALGPHRLPLIGSGDWNDGMNRVGIAGRGESVWLAWFLADVCRRFAALAPEEAEHFSTRAEALAAAVEANAWDGEWYRRAYFDDGTPIGSQRNMEARIDSLSQSWAAICGLADRERCRKAMENATRLLADDALGLIRLLTPPFDHSAPNPGYIMGYPPGIRENGGQYTHGAIWLAMAWARLRDGNRAVELLQGMNPIERTRDRESVLRYRGEPYVTAGDVWTAEGQAGRSGWTWYTGSAAWMYRVWIEEVLGIQIRAGTLFVRPVLPDDWAGFEFTYRHGRTEYRFAVERANPGQAAPVHEGVRLVDDGHTRQIRVLIPAAMRSYWAKGA